MSNEKPEGFTYLADGNLVHNSWLTHEEEEQWMLSMRQIEVHLQTITYFMRMNMFVDSNHLYYKKGK